MEYVIRFAISLFDLAVFMYMGWIYHCCNYMDICQ